MMYSIQVATGSDLTINWKIIGNNAVAAAVLISWRDVHSVAHKLVDSSDPEGSTDVAASKIPDIVVIEATVTLSDVGTGDHFDFFLCFEQSGTQIPVNGDPQSDGCAKVALAHVSTTVSVEVNP